MGHSKSGVTQIVLPDTPQDSVKQSVVPEAVVSESVKQEPKQPVGRSVYQRWNAVMSEVKSVAKLGENKDQKYDYMKAADVLKELRPLFAKHGLVLKANPRAETIDDSEYQSKSGNSTAHFVRMIVDYSLINIDNPEDRVELIGVGDASDYSDKAVHKARTGSLKYTLRDNFLIDDQNDVADSETETPDRAGPQNKVGRQAQSQTQQPAQITTRTMKFTGSVVECGSGESEDSSPYMWFVLHDRTDRMYTFRQEDFQWVKNSNRLVLTCQEKQGRNGKLYWQVTELTAPLTPDFAAGYERTAVSVDKPSLVKPVVETAPQILKRMFPDPKDVKRCVMVERALEDKAPVALHAKILQSLERRIKNENPKGELGVLSLLDISITEILEEAGELFPAEGTAQ